MPCSYVSSHISNRKGFSRMPHLSGLDQPVIRLASKECRFFRDMYPVHVRGEALLSMQKGPLSPTKRRPRNNSSMMLFSSLTVMPQRSKEQCISTGQRPVCTRADKILSMYSRGMTAREIQGHLEEIYGVEVSPYLIPPSTDAVIEEVKEWQSRPMEALYPILFLDALMVKMRYDGRVENRGLPEFAYLKNSGTLVL